MTKHAMWILAMVLLGAGCGKKSSGSPSDGAPAATTEPAEPECENDDDCRRGKVCYLERCVDTSSQRDLLRHKGAVTPAKIRREVEKQTEVRQKQLDRGLDMDE